MAEINWDKLHNENTVKQYEITDKFGSYKYSRYCSIDSLNDCLREKCFFTRRLCDQNDLGEQELHKDQKQNFINIFPLCFCCSSSEKLPLWTLYGGPDLKGSRMTLTSAKMIGFINSIKEVYPTKKVGDNIYADKEHPLKINEDILIKEIGWVKYRNAKKSNNGKDVRIKNTWYTVKDIDEYFKTSYLSKEYIWEYEREFRIVFEYKGTEYNADNKNELLGIAIPMTDLIYKNIKIMFAPNCNKIFFQDLLDSKTKNYDGIKEFLSTKLEFSQYCGEIKINLKKYFCDKCKHKPSSAETVTSSQTSQHKNEDDR